MSEHGKHTPLPWKVHKCSNAGDGEACGIFNESWDGPEHSSYPNVACDMSYDECHHMMTEADAEFICRAVNSHEFLVKALKAILALFPDSQTIEDLKADAGLGFRPCPMTRTPKDSEVIAWRAALAAAGKGD